MYLKLSVLFRMQNNFFIIYHYLFLHVSWPFSNKIPLLAVHQRQGVEKARRKKICVFCQQIRKFHTALPLSQ